MILRRLSLALVFTAAVGCASTNQHGQDTNKAAGATDGNSDNNSLRPSSATPPGRDAERAKERDEEKAEEPKAKKATGKPMEKGRYSVIYI